MAATTAGAIKAYLETQGLGISVKRDAADSDDPWPRVTVDEEVALVPDLDGDFGGDNTKKSAVETATVHVWQRWKDSTTKATLESYTLVPAIRRALHGAYLPAHPTQAYMCRVVSSIRLLERDNNIVHHALTLEISRVL